MMDANSSIFRNERCSFTTISYGELSEDSESIFETSDIEENEVLFFVKQNPALAQSTCAQFHTHSVANDSLSLSTSYFTKRESMESTTDMLNYTIYQDLQSNKKNGMEETGTFFYFP